MFRRSDLPDFFGPLIPGEWPPVRWLINRFSSTPPRRNEKPWEDRADFARARNETLAPAQHLGWQL